MVGEHDHEVNHLDEIGRRNLLHLSALALGPLLYLGYFLYL
jgi:hypothetical protein